MIAYNARCALLGRTGSGKSHAARAMFVSAAEPRLVVDPNDSDLTRVPGAQTEHVSDPARVVATLDAALEASGGTVRVVPRDPFDTELYDAIYRWAFDRAPMFVWSDEAGIIMPASRSPRACRRVLVQGRKRQLGHLACHTRPREIDPNVIAQADHVLLWDLPHPDDRDQVARLAGIPPAELADALGQLDEYEFVWHDVASSTLTICPALPAGVAA